MLPNAGGEPRPIAGATQERKLLGVGSTAKLGSVPALGGMEQRFLTPLLTDNTLLQFWSVVMYRISGLSKSPSQEAASWNRG